MSTRTLAERLHWLEPCVKGLSFCLGDDVLPLSVNVEKTTDPLSVIVTIPLLLPLQKASRQPVRAYFREWAEKIGDCEVLKIPINDHCIKAEVLLKYRKRKVTDVRFDRRS